MTKRSRFRGLIERARPQSTVIRVPSIKTFELVQWISGYVECERMDDLPAHLQDKIYKALEAKSAELKLALAIVAVGCGEEADAPDAEHRYYLRVTASEVVMIDKRQLGTKH